MHKARKFVDIVRKQNNIGANHNNIEAYHKIKELLTEINDSRARDSAIYHQPKEQEITIYAKRKIAEERQLQAAFKFINLITDKLKICKESEEDFDLIEATTRKHQGFGYHSLIEKINDVEKSIGLSIKNSKKEKDNHVIYFKNPNLGKLFESICDYYSIYYEATSNGHAADKKNTTKYNLDSSSFEKLSGIYKGKANSKYRGCSIM